MIMVSVSLSLASWKGAEPHTSMYRITPRDQISGEIREFEKRRVNITLCMRKKKSFSEKDEQVEE